VATVTSGGLVQTLAPGSTTITATLDTVSDSVPVVVTALNLQMSLAGTGLTFSWPTDATTSFILESSPVTGPDAVWTAVSGTPTVVGSNYQIEVPTDPETAAAYFRLRLQP
jgi:hypothetical protein